MAYKHGRAAFLNPTNAVGGSFILGLQSVEPTQLPESHQRGWWTVHTQPKYIVIPVRLAYPPAMHVDPFKEISWAFQLHYHACFRTHRRKPFLDDQSRKNALSEALVDLCNASDVHLLEKRFESQHAQLVLSLRPSQVISEVMKKLKGRSSAAICQGFNLTPPLWARGYLARSVGRVKTQAVKTYLARQSEHHGYSNRALPPVFRFRAPEPRVLATAHASFNLNHHLVLATKFRHGMFDSKVGESLVSYWVMVADRRGFAIDQATVLPDHVHLLVRITPKMSVEQMALSLMNNGQYFVAKHFPGVLVEAKVDRLWQASAYVGTCGEVTTALLKSFLKGETAG